jgi:1-acyl-sn-glycerol-3-phosphate acyltransferase
VLGRAGRGLYALYLLLTLPVIVMPLWLLVWLVPARRLAFALGRLTVRLALRVVGCRLQVEGVENLRGVGPVILASNHASYSDVPGLMALVPLDFVFVSKLEARAYPIVGTYIRRSRHLTVDRFDVQQSVADAGTLARAIEEGDPVLVFPEGTFTSAAGLRPFRLGACKTAVETGTPVVPLALRGTRQVLRGDWWLPKPGAIHLWIGPPIPPRGEGWRAVVDLRDRVFEAILAHCGEPRLEIVSGGPVRP